MAKNRDDELNQKMDGSKEGTEFSLEDILAEFGEKSPHKTVQDDTIPFPILPKGTYRTPTGRKPGRVVSFPTGTEVTPPMAEKEREQPDPGPDLLEEVQPKPKFIEQKPDKNEETDKIVAFPDQESERPASDNPIAEKLNRLVRKADQYAEHMFEEEGVEEAEDVLRAERYIPGTDQEEETEPKRERRRRSPPPPAPDLPPAELVHRYQKGLKGLRTRMYLVFLLAVAALGITLTLSAGIPLPEEFTPQMQALVLAGILCIAMLLGLDVLLKGLFHLFQFQMGMDTLLFRLLRDPYRRFDNAQAGLKRWSASLLCIELSGNLAADVGVQLKLRGQRLACRTAATAAHPYLITLDEAVWNNRDAYSKWSGDVIGFGRQIQASDGAERLFHLACPLLFIACLALSIVASVGREAPERMLWCLSASLTAGASLSGSLCYGIPWYQLSFRLSKSGAAIAGWDGVTSTSGGCGILLMDTDLFPTGYVRMNGLKVFGDFPVDKVISNTATLIRDCGSGLDKIFHDQLRAQGCVYRRAVGLEFHEGGGVSAEIRGEQVLVGSGSFMQLMEVALPQGLNVKNAVFCAIDGELAGVFALNYTLHGLIEPSLNALIRNHLNPVLATRDFNLIPSILQQRFKLPTDKMEFPPIERRIELSEEDRLHSPILTAVLCREGVGPYSEAVVGASRLRRAVHISAGLAAAGAAIGVLLVYYITSAGAYASLSPFNLLVFQAMWLVPTFLIAGWVNKY